MSSYSGPKSATLSPNERAVLETMRTIPDYPWQAQRLSQATAISRGSVHDIMYRLGTRGMVARDPAGGYRLSDFGRDVNMDTYRMDRVADPLNPTEPYTGRLGSGTARTLMAAMREAGRAPLTYQAIEQLGVISIGSVAKSLKILRMAGWISNSQHTYVVTEAGRAADLAAPEPKPAAPEPTNPLQHVGHWEDRPRLADTRRRVDRLPACPRCGGKLGIQIGMVGDPHEVVCLMCNRTARSMGLPYSVRRKKETAA